MTLKKIDTKNAPKVVGPYSQAIVDIKTGIVYLSGQIAVDPVTNKFNENQTAEEQTEKIIQNIKAVLEESDSSLDRVLKVRIYLTDMSDYIKVNEVYGRYFTNHNPARVAIGVTSLPIGAKVEIECEAKVK